MNFYIYIILNFKCKAKLLRKTKKILHYFNLKFRGYLNNKIVNKCKLIL